MGIIEDFISTVIATHSTGVATEHSYRPALQELFNSLADGVTAVNEPKRVACGAPDFNINRGEILIGCVEAKDLDVALRKMKGANKNQQDRYREAQPNLIYTNCLDWDFYRNGELLASVTIANFHGGRIQAQANQSGALEHLLRDFIAQRPQTITTPHELAKRMAGKAGLIKDILGNALRADKDLQTELSAQFQTFKENLLHDITPEDFADIYAETIAYGMFAARLHDMSLENFSRTEALTLLPKSNPFLRSLFGFVAGVDLDDRIAWVIDDLAAVFQAANVQQIMEGFGKLTGPRDPFLHFYETFLAAYNPAKRKACGVWYTPEPVVNFIVRAVDEVLKIEFGLPDGLADTSKVMIDWDTGQADRKGKRCTIKKEVHRVQVLDPATGTGTFLAEVIKQIAPKVKGIAPGMWSTYIENDLIPRVHGFELLMASYAMCHMKLDMILTELGYKPTGSPPRLSVYLTNSLEEGEPIDQALPFTQWLSREAKGANTIKRDMPIMCVIGNPPYLGEGGKSEGWIGTLMEDYKKEPGGKVKLQERNPKWLNDLYVKFIRLSSHMIEKNGEGILGFITNHGYLDNPTFRGMRWHLLKTFDRIWVLDLHGNAKKKEVTPEGKPDKNVFDIQQGVAIIIAVKKKGNRKRLAEVMHGDLWGERKAKYETLATAGLSSPVFSELKTPSPQHPLVKRDYDLERRYSIGISLSELMPINSMGVMTKRDTVAIHFSSQKVKDTVADFARLERESLEKKYRGIHDARDWNLAGVKKNIREFGEDHLRPIMYRPFDYRHTYYTNFSRGFLAYPVFEVGRHMLQSNYCLTTIRKADVVQNWSHAFCLDGIMVHHGISMKEGNYIFPLYLYPTEQDLDQARRVNFEPALYKRLQELATHPGHGTPGELEVFDFIYGVLHCPAYRETYAEFLKIDFPRIPWPASPDEFWDVSAKGKELRKLHLMDPAAIGETPYPFTGDGDNVVGKPRFEDGKVWINDTQYFNCAPKVSWGFYIGGYQPAQKWLKDRKGRALSFEDVKHYQRILKILSETDRIMKEITMNLAT
jgi:type I restriction-modification system DNA methylase subunit